MSRLSIYEVNWIDLVFENKNKEYGAYQLRRDSSKTTVMAFFSGILLIIILGLLYTSSHLFKSPIVVDTNILLDEPIKVTPYHVQPITPKSEPKTKTAQTKATKEPTVFLPMVVSSTPDIIADVPINKEINEMNTSDSGTDLGTDLGAVNTTSGTSEIPDLPIDDGKGINIASQLDKLPEFPGGIQKFYSYVGNNFEKPEIEAANKMRIFVSFVIEKDGSMTDIKVINDPGYGLGKEAIRVLKSLKTKWTPGIIKSKPVRTSYNLPITIQMN